MRAISLERSSFTSTAAVSLVTFAALVLLGAVLAYWTWAWFGPRPEPPAQTALQAAGRVEAAYGLFGNAQRKRHGEAATGIVITLLGVVAAAGRQPGYALLRLDSKETVAVREGGEIEPGVRLAQVYADHVVLERSGLRETLTWPKQDTPALPATPLAGN